jgi:hypothetical protein
LQLNATAGFAIAGWRRSMPVPLDARASPRLSVVAPCFNEEAGLEQFHRRITAAAQDTVGSDYELILLNDGSTDRTWAIMTDLVRRDPHLVAVNLSRRHGHQLAMTAGLYTCRGDRILTIDADLQDPPELLGEIWRLMERVEADVVYGLRRERQGETMLKRGTAALFYRLMRRVGYADMPVDAGDFRLMTRRVLDILNSMPEQHRFIRGMVSWIGLRQVPLAYDRAPRHSGTSNYSLAKMMGLAFDALTSFSIMPLAGVLSRAAVGLSEPAHARLHARELGARPCRRRLDQLADGGADPRLDATHYVRPARRICRAALHRDQAPAAVRDRSGSHPERSRARSVPRGERALDRPRRRFPVKIRLARSERTQKKKGAVCTAPSFRLALMDLLEVHSAAT